MSKRTTSAILKDMREAIHRILSYTKNMNYEDFANDSKTQDAIIRNIEILGEAAKLLPDSTKSQFTRIPWRDIAGTRDRLIHDYFGVNIDIVWDIVTNEIPKVKGELENRS